jgi:hypothetical protein
MLNGLDAIVRVTAERDVIFGAVRKVMAEP